MRAAVVVVAVLGLYQPADQVAARAQHTPQQTHADQERQLFQELLRSLSIQRQPLSSPNETPSNGYAITTAATSAPAAAQPIETKRMRAPSQAAAGTPGGAAAKSTGQIFPAADSVLLDVCPGCGSPLRRGRCAAQAAVTCLGHRGSGNGADGGGLSGANADLAANNVVGTVGSLPGEPSATTSTAFAPSGAKATNPRSGSSGVDDTVPDDPRLLSTGYSAGQVKTINAIASRAANAIAANGGGGNQPHDPLGLTGAPSAIIDNIHAAAAVGPGLRWKVVKPTGMDPTASEPAVSLESGETNDRGDHQRSFTLDIGVVRSELQTGPENPLLVPPGVASVVYLIDCSSSMSGERFSSVAAAVADAVVQLNANQRFAVLLFNNLALQIDDGGLLAATDANKRLLRSQLSQVIPVGGTNPTDVLLIALQMKPESVIVFSDGEFDSQTVQRVTRLNRSSGLNCQINCVGVGAQVAVLRTLASLNGPGSYIETP